MSSIGGEPTRGETVHREYIMDVRVVELHDGADTRYRFEAPRHQGIEFDDAELAELYADVYFDVNGFEEAGTGERGVPPIIIQAGRDTLAAYFLTQPYTDRQWVGSFMGVQPGKIERYVSRVRKRAENIRRKAAAELCVVRLRTRRRRATGTAGR
ncbi:MAG: hypothetical protein V5A39_14990 [Haloarculaceae archaeon]